jgi:LmbE family N-acetylglucosaminyl deacetylase
MKVLVVSAHPDDEVLGCGGTLARHVAAGDEVSVLFLSEGVSSRSTPGQQRDWTKEIAEREEFARRASAFLGFSIAGFLRHPNLRMRGLPMLDLVKQVDAVIRAEAPQVIYTHHAGDMNSDHGVAVEAVLTACRPVASLSVRAIYAFEVLSSTEWNSPALAAPFAPTRYVDITAFLERKIEAMACYDHEMRAMPHPRSPEAVRALACYRGVSIGVAAAEAFVVLRELIRD